MNNNIKQLYITRQSISSATLGISGKVLVKTGKAVFKPHFVSEFLWNHHRCDQSVTQKENQEKKREDWNLWRGKNYMNHLLIITKNYTFLRFYLPFTTRMGNKLIQGPSIVKLIEISQIEKREQKAKSSPHPRMETLNGNIHIVSFSQCFETIQAALLVSELKVLYKTWNNKNFKIKFFVKYNLLILSLMQTQNHMSW